MKFIYLSLKRKSLIRLIFLIPALLFSNPFLKAQDFYESQRKEWMLKAEENKPVLKEVVKLPVQLVELKKDKSFFQEWKAVTVAPMDSLYKSSFKKKSGVVIDFGEHLTGYASFTISPTGTPDAPLRFKFTFGEVPSELAASLDSFPGTLSRAWMQDEVITVMDLGNTPITKTIPRRIAFRYLKIELIGSSPYFDFAISNIEFKATTSVNSTPSELSKNTDPMIALIDQVGIATLKECMQSVYEDGPKRDRRLWIGDLYLESLANTYSFKNHSLTKRCLFLLAGLSDQNGNLISNVFETPEPHAQKGVFLFDYCLLYNAALKEYLSATNDRETALSLWPVAKKQLEIPKKYLDKNGIFDAERAGKEWWLFVDWKEGLDKQVPLQGLILYTFKQTYELAKMIGKEKEVAELPALIKLMTENSRKRFLDKSTGLFLSDTQKQVSYASQAWMILGGVATKEEGRKAINALISNKTAFYPGAPYLYHYYVEAMIQCGMNKEAKELIVNYWGGMVKKGATTFWEVYDEKNDFLSPYNFYPLNSYCHAWSCTPVYFIRKYPEIFQK
jgi:alpha-L-rhamnosidase